MAVRFLVACPSSDLVRLPWHQPLEKWDESLLVPLARGISRHVEMTSDSSKPEAPRRPPELMQAPALDAEPWGQSPAALLSDRFYARAQSTYRHLDADRPEV